MAVYSGAKATRNDEDQLNPTKPAAPGGYNNPDQTGIVPNGDRVIPGAGVYGQQQANAEVAWQNARAAAEAKKNSQYNVAGLLSDGSVDPRNQYGAYQAMLMRQGGGLDQARDNAMERGLGGGPGLGNQAERTLRYANAVEGLGFQGNVNQIATDYGLAMGDADTTRRDAMTTALQQALSNAWGDWTPPDMAPDVVANTKVANTQKSATAKLAAATLGQSKNAVKNTDLSQFGWGAAATFAKAKKKK